MGVWHSWGVRDAGSALVPSFAAALTLTLTLDIPVPRFHFPPLKPGWSPGRLPRPMPRNLQGERWS